MDTLIVKTKDGKDYNQFGDIVIVCELCKIHKTTMIGTKRCNWCWELETRMLENPDLAKKIFMQMKNDGII